MGSSTGDLKKVPGEWRYTTVELWNHLRNSIITAWWKKVYKISKDITVDCINSQSNSWIKSGNTSLKVKMIIIEYKGPKLKDTNKQ